MESDNKKRTWARGLGRGRGFQSSLSTGCMDRSHFQAYNGRAFPFMGSWRIHLGARRMSVRDGITCQARGRLSRRSVVDQANVCLEFSRISSRVAEGSSPLM